MKQKAIGKKMSLNKNTIARLGASELDAAYGGALNPILETKVTRVEQSCTEYSAYGSPCFTDYLPICVAATFGEGEY